MKTTSLIVLVCSLLLCLSTPLKGQNGTFTVYLPKLVTPPDEEGQGWQRPPVWGGYNNLATDDSIVIPDGRPIYALIVSGYAQNGYFDQLLVYKFARHLMERGAYVHYAWWNNLLAPYMERPLHYDQSYPGNLGQDFLNFTTVNLANNKALPGEDYQFVEDAKLFLSAIRQHNPNAIIIVVGHSMGGGAIVHLASPWNTDEHIDILAPIDPVGNRNYPWAGTNILGSLRFDASDFNWTRWRITRDRFLGYKVLNNFGGPINPNCEPAGSWLADYNAAKENSDLLCRTQAPYIHNPVVPLTFGENVVHLFYRYQKEALFPFDFDTDYHFGHTPPPGFTEQDEQTSIPMTPEFCGGIPPQRCQDPGGWPATTLPGQKGCCPTGNGVGWPHDGHGEIVGYRGPITTGPVPLGVRVRTSPDCGSQCNNLNWPWRHKTGGVWVDPDANYRRSLLQELESLPAGSTWENRPTNPDLCLVSDDLIDLFDQIVTDVRIESGIPKHFFLEQNFPNPFNPSTKIKYSVPEQSKVIIKVYDLLGREAATLVNEEKSTGHYEIDFDAGSLPSGVYFYRLQADDFVKIRKMILLK